MTVFLVIIYLMSGALYIQKTPFKSVETCVAVGEARVKQLVLDPKVDDVLFAACVPSEATEVKS